MVTIPEVPLSSGGSMPLVGMGTAAAPLDESAMKSAILRAIELGYRHFDTASFYRSEKPLGEAIAEALRVGLIKSRDELFITSKLWCTDARHDLVLPALQKSLQNLQLEYLDLYLIHWPISVNPEVGFKYPIDKDQLLPMDFKSVWASMEESKKLGLTKSIGVSNFSCKKLQLLLDIAEIPPAVNQVEMNPVWQQKKLIEFCKAHGIIVAAYSPLGAWGARWGTHQVMECEALKEIAKARGKTIAQVCLRWIHEQGACLLVKSFNEERMKENLGIFDWALSEDDCNKINQIPQRKFLRQEDFVSVNGPYKSVEELWDGEI